MGVRVRRRRSRAAGRACPGPRVASSASSPIQASCVALPAYCKTVRGPAANAGRAGLASILIGQAAKMARDHFSVYSRLAYEARAGVCCFVVLQFSSHWRATISLSSRELQLQLCVGESRCLTHNVAHDGRFIQASLKYPGTTLAGGIIVRPSVRPSVHTSNIYALS